MDIEQYRKNTIVIETFFNICEKWKLNEYEQICLLGISNPLNFYRLKQNKFNSIEKDIMIRISYILKIYSLLQLIFLNENQADYWIKKKNKMLNNFSALDTISSEGINGIIKVISLLYKQVI